MKNEIELRQKLSEGICMADLSFILVEENCRGQYNLLHAKFLRGGVVEAFFQKGLHHIILALLQMHENMQRGSPIRLIFPWTTHIDGAHLFALRPPCN